MMSIYERDDFTDVTVSFGKEGQYSRQAHRVILRIV
jgi:hypothetical protein